MHCGHMHCGIWDKAVLGCYVIKKHVIKGSCDFIGGRPSKQVIILLSLVVIGTLVAEI